MATAQEYTDRFLLAYSRVPPAVAGVCRVCHSGPNTGFQTCYSCELTMSQVGYPVKHVLPISLYRVSDQVWKILRHYKDHPDAGVRAYFGTVVAATISRFVAYHWDCITARVGQVSLVTTVPSTCSRPAEHPLVAAVRRVSRLAGLHRAVLTRGAGEVDHQLAGDDAFVVSGGVHGERVLIVDDTFTSGARAQSAGSVLRSAGARSVAVLAVGRVIDPTRNDNCRQIWAYARSGLFAFEECCFCADPTRGLSG